MVWDIGVGLGLVGLEVVCLCCNGYVYVIEKNVDDVVIV